MSSSSLSCQKFALDDIKKATSDFSDANIIGTGVFGNVYHRQITRNSQNGVVAVKRLNLESKKRFPEFQKEIDLLSSCHHDNIVSLLGYCDEQDEKILVYEFMPYGSLYRCLYEFMPNISAYSRLCEDHTCLLTVEQRLKICLGVANGLHYLHSHPHYNIVYSNLKSENILLDSNWVAKISNMGLSSTPDVGRFFSEKLTNQSKGTDGYIAPECFNRNYEPSQKEDIYAFGMVLLEVLCERRPWDSPPVLANLSLNEMELHKIVVPFVETNISPDCARACEILIRDCLLTDPEKRPSISRVVADLGSTLALQKQNWDDKGQNIRSKGNRRLFESILPHTKPRVFSSRDDLIVLYYTSSPVVVDTHQKCQDTRWILDGYGKRVDERDLNLDPTYMHQIRKIFVRKEYTLPQLFIGGNHIGGADEIQRLHSSRELGLKFKSLPNRDYPSYCSDCGNTRFVPCLKGLCKECNANGLLRCPACCFWK